MKNRRWISFLMAVVMLFTVQAVFPAAKGLAEGGSLGIQLSRNDIQLKSNDALLKDYIRRAFYPRASAKGDTAGSKLTGRSKLIYNALVPLIQEVAAGARSSTKFLLPVNDLYGKTTFTYEELGLGTNPSDEEIFNALVPGDFFDAILYDYPFDLYWFDKARPYSWGLDGGYTDGYAVYLDSANVVITMIVAQEYAVSDYETDTTTGQTVRNAVNRAKDIVAAHAGENNLQKLTSYKDEICDLVEYNGKAMDESVPYGNPWQLVWVFDGDPSTDVVCEGYSKAFQYLCDLSTFTNGVKAISVTGDMDGGAHMWNIVTLDGQRLLVDVTNTDDGTTGYPDVLFLVYADDGNVDTGYYYEGIHYVYDEVTKNSYRRSELIMAGGNDDPYAEPVYTVTVSASGNGTAYADPGSGVEGTEVTLTAIPDADCIFKEWQVLAGHVVLLGDTFTIGKENVEIQAVFEPIAPPTHTLRIDYIYQDAGGNGKGSWAAAKRTQRETAAAPSYVAELAEGESYSVESPPIYRYTPDQDVVSGVMGSEDITVTVVYTQKTEDVLTDDIGYYRVNYLTGAATFIGVDPSKTNLTSLTIYGLLSDGVQDFTVTAIEKDACRGLKKLATVTIEDQITVIGNSAFRDCVRLKKIDGGKQVKTIDSDAFRGCKALTKITLSSRVTSVGSNAFNGCVKLKTVSGGEAVTKIGAGAFSGCSRLTALPAFEKLTAIGENAFKGCKTLTKITLSAKVKKIGKNAFYGCAKLKTITIRTKLLKASTVGANAFKGIYSKPTVKCPSGMKKTYRTLLLKKGMPKKAIFK